MRMPCGHGQTVDAPPCMGEVRAEDAKRWWACGRHVRTPEGPPQQAVRHALCSALYTKWNDVEGLAHVEGLQQDVAS